MTVAALAALAWRFKPMPGFKESSILFSLQGLMERERERTDEEKLERLRAIEQANAVRLERERRQRDAQDQRVREEQARVLREQAEAREHHARAEAMKRAELERVRLEAESRSRLETLAMEREHERRMAAIELESRVRRFRALATGGLAFGVVTLACTAVLYFGKLKPEQTRLEGAYAKLVSAQQARGDDAQDLADRQKHDNDKLAGELAAVRGKLADARQQLSRLSKTPPVQHARVIAPVKKTPAAPAGPCGDPDDPMNGCLE